MEIVEQAYGRFMVFQTMYLAACNSSELIFHQKMIWILEGLADPHFTRIQTPYIGWVWSGTYFMICADQVGCLRMDLRRIRWYKMLKLVRLFVFIPSRNVDTWVTIDGVRMTQNHWIYG